MQYFENTDIMLFLNKKDLFKNKVKISDIANIPHFADYDGPPKDFNAGGEAQLVAKRSDDGAPKTSLMQLR